MEEGRKGRCQTAYMVLFQLARLLASPVELEQAKHEEYALPVTLSHSLIAVTSEKS